MWFNKKELKETPKEPETTVLYKRIEKLYSRLQELNHNGEYQSKLGKRQFKITKERDYDIPRECIYSTFYCYYNISMVDPNVKIKEKRYLQGNFNVINYEVETERELFILKVWKNKTKLEPCPINLTAHEIDLAILEFENYIETIYQEHKAKIKELEG